MCADPGGGGTRNDFSGSGIAPCVPVWGTEGLEMTSHRECSALDSQERLHGAGLICTLTLGLHFTGAQRALGAKQGTLLCAMFCVSKAL